MLQSNTRQKSLRWKIYTEPAGNWAICKCARQGEAERRGHAQRSISVSWFHWEQDCTGRGKASPARLPAVAAEEGDGAAEGQGWNSNRKTLSCWRNSPWPLPSRCIHSFIYCCQVVEYIWEADSLSKHSQRTIWTRTVTADFLNLRSAMPKCNWAFQPGKEKIGDTERIQESHGWPGAPKWLQSLLISLSLAHSKTWDHWHGQLCCEVLVLSVISSLFAVRQDICNASLSLFHIWRVWEAPRALCLRRAPVNCFEWQKNSLVEEWEDVNGRWDDELTLELKGYGEDVELAQAVTMGGSRKTLRKSGVNPNYFWNFLLGYFLYFQLSAYRVALMNFPSTWPNTLLQRNSRI